MHKNAVSDDLQVQLHIDLRRTSNYVINPQPTLARGERLFFSPCRMIAASYARITRI